MIVFRTLLGAVNKRSWHLRGGRGQKLPTDRSKKLLIHGKMGVKNSGKMLTSFVDGPLLSSMAIIDKIAIELFLKIIQVFDTFPTK